MRRIAIMMSSYFVVKGSNLPYKSYHSETFLLVLPPFGNPALPFINWQGQMERPRGQNIFFDCSRREENHSRLEEGASPASAAAIRLHSNWNKNYFKQS